MQCAVKPVAAAVTCKHASRTIPAMRCRGKADEKQSRVRIAETRVGFAPIIHLVESRCSIPRNFLSPLDKARAEIAPDDFRLQSLEFGMMRFRHGVEDE